MLPLTISLASKTNENQKVLSTHCCESLSKPCTLYNGKSTGGERALSYGHDLRNTKGFEDNA